MTQNDNPIPERDVAELIEATREVIDAALRQLAYIGKGRAPSPRLQDAIDRAEAAVAKAELTQ